MSAGWLDPSELRVGLGCMRLSTTDNFKEGEGAATIAAAAAAGVTVFDTAHAYGQGPDDYGRNERLVAQALRESGAADKARIVTKGGMTRAGDQWIPDGRAKTILSDCDASLVALDGLMIDLYLIHAPDPRTPWLTTLRALARLADEGLVQHVGVANVNRRQLDEALALTNITAVQVGLSLYDDRALRGGLVEFCERRRITLLAHSPLGGPRRVAGVNRRQALADVARAHGGTPAQVALAWLLQLSPAVVPIPGARRPENARSAARAAKVRLGAGDRGTLASAFGLDSPVRSGRRRSSSTAEVVIIMGIPGAGKSGVAGGYVAKGYVRLNRDELGGSLPALASTLNQRLSDGARRVVLDNTYLTRAARSYVIQTAKRNRASITCIWLNTPLAQAQVNLVERLLDRFGSLPSPEELRQLARREPGMLMPTSQMRALRELEQPATDEGLDRVEVVPFSRTAPSDRPRAGVFVAAAALSLPGWKEAIAQGAPGAPHLVFDWSPGSSRNALRGAVARISDEVAGPVDSAICPHQGGPPRCWCRPTLPGLPLAFARAHGVDPSRSILVGTGPAHRTLATTLGARYVPV
ncbi:MAG: aldo/keto reductase [Candidatus Dormibacteraeota bacterium]|nr:aldo/keto reductase [Candidatus Dormibacteraeota bacterium]